MRRQTRHTNIPPEVKRRVWERDNERCIICGAMPANPDAHYIGRAQGGLGVEQNIVTLCRRCHSLYDQSAIRPAFRRKIREYLVERYESWDESELVYRKFRPSKYE